jgi:hypothetical protein
LTARPWLKVLIVAASLGLILFMFDRRTEPPDPERDLPRPDDVYGFAPPSGWTKEAPRADYLMGKWKAPKPPFAMMTVGVRSSLWRDDVTSSLYDDAWRALDAIGETVFRERFDRNDDQVIPKVLEVRKVEVRGQKAIFVDYELATPSGQRSVRLRTHFVLHKHRWWSITAGSNMSEPAAHLEEMMLAVQTFKAG